MLFRSSGVPDIYAVWNEAGYVDPTVEEQFGNGQPNRTIVTLPLVTKKGDFSEKRQAKSQPKSQEKGRISKASMMEARKEKVLQMIKTGEFSTVPAIAGELGLTDRQVRTVIDQLKKTEKVYFKGAGRDGHWVAKEK